MTTSKPPDHDNHFLSLYKTLKKAGLSKDFLQANSATHSFLLGAIAELVDNAKDAEATHLEIGMEKFNEKDSLTFLDNGTGMNPQELTNVIKIGRRQNNESKVGRYGHGLKAGSMRLAHECLVLTKKRPKDGTRGSRSALLLSRSFLENNKLEELHVAMPSFELDSDQRLVTEGEHVESTLHLIEKEVIDRYCGLKDKELFDLFDRIDGQGTMVVLFNLRREVTGEPELDWTSDPEDVKTKDPDNPPLDRTSLREYLKLLYYEPTMTITLRGRPVLLQRPVSELYLGNGYAYKPKNMLHARDQEIKERQKLVDQAHEKLIAANEEYGKLQYRPGQTNREIERDRRLLAHDVTTSEKEYNEAMEQLHAKQTSNVEEKIFCGFYPYKKKISGALVYISGRLVEAVQTLDCQKKKANSLKGLTAIVNLPTKVLFPTSNKQGLESTKDRATLLKVMSDTMKSHFDNVIVPYLQKESLYDMWRRFGCPTDEDVFEQKRDQPTMEAIHRSVGHTVLCRSCLQWKKLSYSPYLSSEKHTVEWKCNFHPDVSKRECGVPDRNLDPALKKFLPPNVRRDPRSIAHCSARPSSSSQFNIGEMEQKPDIEVLNRLSAKFTIPRKGRDLPAPKVPVRAPDHSKPKIPPRVTVVPSPPKRVSPRKARIVEEESDEEQETPPRRQVTVSRNGRTESMIPKTVRRSSRPEEMSLARRHVVEENEDEEEEEIEPVVETPPQRSSRRNGPSTGRVVDGKPETSRRSMRTGRTSLRKRHAVEDENDEETVEAPSKRKVTEVANGEEKVEHLVSGERERTVPILFLQLDNDNTNQEIAIGVTPYEIEMILSQLVNYGVPKSWGRRKFQGMEDYADLAKACNQETNRRV